jgi:hypothetical protein
MMGRLVSTLVLLLTLASVKACKSERKKYAVVVMQRRDQFGNSPDYFQKTFKDYEDGFGQNGETLLADESAPSIPSPQARCGSASRSSTASPPRSELSACQCIVS